MNDELFAIEDITVALATRLMEEKGMDMIDALDAIYNSDTFAKAMPISTTTLTTKSKQEKWDSARIQPKSVIRACGISEF